MTLHPTREYDVVQVLSLPRDRVSDDQTKVFSICNRLTITQARSSNVKSIDIDITILYRYISMVKSRISGVSFLECVAQYTRLN
jgi:hypothetical protein